MAEVTLTQAQRDRIRDIQGLGVKLVPRVEAAVLDILTDLTEYTLTAAIGRQVAAAEHQPQTYQTGTINGLMIARSLIRGASTTEVP